jgi:glycerol-3-phosphate O-acyltransferase
MLAMTAQLPARAETLGRVPAGVLRLRKADAQSLRKLLGRPKEKESVLMLLRTIPELRSRFGKVYASFGEPLPLDPLIARHAPGWSRATDGTDDRPPWLAPLVSELATEIMTRINAAACVTPVNLVGLVLLAMPRQSMGAADLARQVELYASLMPGAVLTRAWVTTMDGTSMISTRSR